MYKYKRRRIRPGEKALYVRMTVDGKRKWIKVGKMQTHTQHVWWDHDSKDGEWRQLMRWGEES